MKRLLAAARSRLLTMLIVAAAGLLAVRLATLVTAPESARDDSAAQLAAELAKIVPAAGEKGQKKDEGKKPAETEAKKKEEKTPSGEKTEKKAEPGQDRVMARARREALTTDPSLYSEAEIKVLQDLQARREAIDKRERDVVLREGLLKATEKRVAQKIAELQKLKALVDGLIKRQERAQSKKIQSLVKIYGKMKPADAARILSRLDMPVLLDVLRGMKETKVAPILAAMDPQKARDITANMAARRNELRLLPGTGS